MFSSKVKRRLQNQSNRLQFRQLEGREMLTSIDLLEGSLFARGSASADTIDLAGSADFQSITVTISNDSEGTITQTFNRSEVTEILVFAGDGDDTVTNTLVDPTQIFGEGGNDNLQGGFSNDTIFGGGGDDFLFGRNGDDLLIGQAGNDTLDGVNGNDNLQGSDGDDTINGSNGDDIIIGGLGDDTLAGGSGNDLLNGNEDNDTIFGGAGDDVVNGGRGADEIFGASGADTLAGNGGDDFINGGADDDTIRGGSGEDRLIGANGDDSVIGSSGNDFIAGNAGNDDLFGGLGNDMIFGGVGDEGFINGGRGNDRIDGGEGTDNSFYFGSPFEHRVTEVGQNSQVADIRIQDGEQPLDSTLVNGTDVLIDVETIDFTDGLDPRPIEELLQQPVLERVVVQPIIVSDNNGSNQAPFFGNAQQEAETLDRIDRIFNQAGVDVQFLDEVQFNNTFVNSGSGVTEDRPVSDLGQIISVGEEAGVFNSDPNVINIFFVQDAPGTQLSSISPVNAALFNDNGVVLQLIDLPQSVVARERSAFVIVQGIARNLGLAFTPGESNVLNPALLDIFSASLDLEPILTQIQSDQILASDFTQPI